MRNNTTRAAWESHLPPEPSKMATDRQLSWRHTSRYTVHTVTYNLYYSTTRIRGTVCWKHLLICTMSSFNQILINEIEYEYLDARFKGLSFDVWRLTRFDVRMWLYLVTNVNDCLLLIPHTTHHRPPEILLGILPSQSPTWSPLPMFHPLRPLLAKKRVEKDPPSLPGWKV